MKLPSVYTDLCFKQIFENATAGRDSRCRSVVNSAISKLLQWLFLFQPVQGHVVWLATRGSLEGVYDN
jgi:hypothetical protein